MKRAKALTRVVFLGACLPALIFAQAIAPAQPPSQVLPTALSMAPSYNSLYCAGFITDRTIEEGLFVLAGVEDGMKNEFVPGDVVFLNKGSNWVTNPSGEYMVLRRVRDIVETEIFKGQRRLMEQLGTMYREMGRLRVNIVHDKSATAQVLHTCESVTVGDILIPFNVKAAPPLKPSAGFDAYAPPTGKTNGMIVYGKEFVMSMGAGENVYLDIGANQNVTVGQYYRVYRPFDTYSKDKVWRHMGNYIEKASGVRMGMRLTREQQMSLPRDVLGELVITHVEGRSATGLITFAQKEIFIGDQVELQ